MFGWLEGYIGFAAVAVYGAEGLACGATRHSRRLVVVVGADVRVCPIGSRRRAGSPGQGWRRCADRNALRSVSEEPVVDADSHVVVLSGFRRNRTGTTSSSRQSSASYSMYPVSGSTCDRKFRITSS
jgi:hypothetical protein